MHILQTWKERRDIDENGNNSHRDRGDPCVRMKGEGDCCGGGSGNKPKKVKAKHLEDPVIGQITLHIEGMTCEHCVNRVAEALNSIDGVSAKVNLHKKNATVSFDRPVEEETLCSAVEKAGYRVLSVSDIK